MRLESKKNNSVTIIRLVGLLMSLGAASLAGVQAAVPVGGEVIVRQSPETIKLEQPATGSEQIVPVAGPGFDQAVRIVSQKRGNAWDVQFHLPLTRPVAKGEVLLAHFWARTLQTRAESGVGTVGVTVQKSTPDWDASIGRSVNVPTQWQEFYFRGASKADYAAGGMTFDFRCGGGEQTLEFGGIELLSYGNRVAVTDLPSTKSTYAGRELSAPWRAAAAARIQKYRTAPFTVHVQDSAGKPVGGASVHMLMTRNAFGFGAAVLAQRLTGQSPADLVYQQTLRQNFNSASFVNDLKWQAWIGEWGGDLSRTNALAGLQWAKAHDLDFRGHVLVWPSWHNLPHMMGVYKDQPDRTAALAAVREHISDEVAATRGYVSEWDVVNEPFDNHDLMDAYGKDIMVDWFREAHQISPSARLSLNDYSILTSQTDTPHEQAYEDTARYLLAHGAPLNILGMQGHFGDTPPTPTRVYELLSRYAKLGCKIRVTEFTVDTDDEALRADWTRDFMTILYSHPDVIGFQCWTFDDFFDLQTGQPKPAGKAFQALALHQWRTDLTDRSSKAGLVQGRGFLGAYTVTATRGGKTVSQSFTLKPGSAPLVLTLQ